MLNNCGKPHTWRWCLLRTDSTSSGVELLCFEVERRTLLNCNKAFDFECGTCFLARRHPGALLSLCAQLFAHNLSVPIFRQIRCLQAANGLCFAPTENHHLGQPSPC